MKYSVSMQGLAAQLGGFEAHKAEARMRANGASLAKGLLPQNANKNALPEAEVETGLLGLTRVKTPEGAISVEDLSLGQAVLGSDGLQAKITHLATAEMTKQAICLRAPYFGLDQDLVLGSDHRIAVTSDLAEYLFGVQTVLVPAWALKDNRRATHWEIEPRTKLYQIQLSRPVGLLVGSCRLEAGLSTTTEIGLRLSEEEARCFAVEHHTGYQS